MIVGNSAVVEILVDVASELEIRGWLPGPGPESPEGLSDWDGVGPDTLFGVLWRMEPTAARWYARMELEREAGASLPAWEKRYPAREQVFQVLARAIARLGGVVPASVTHELEQRKPRKGGWMVGKRVSA